MQKKVFLALLYLSFFWELFVTGGSLFAAPTMLAQAGFTVTDQAVQMAVLTGWIILFLTILVGYIIYLVHKNERIGWTLAGLIAAWWVAIGIGVYIQFGMQANLISDSLKGALLLIFAYLSSPASQGSVRSAHQPA